MLDIVSAQVQEHTYFYYNVVILRPHLRRVDLSDYQLGGTPSQSWQIITRKVHQNLQVVINFNATRPPLAKAR
jgi:hypothetical protein